MTDLTGWLTLEQAAAVLSTSTKTIERRIAAGEIEEAKRPIPGRKPETVCRPEDVERLKPSTHLMPAKMPFPGELPNTEMRLGTRPMEPRPSPLEDLATVMSAAMSFRMDPPPLPRWIQLEEAERVSGLSQRILKRAIRRKLLNAIKDGTQWKIDRNNLEQFAGFPPLKNSR